MSVDVSVHWSDVTANPDCVCIEEDSGEALATVVAIDRIILEGSDPEDSGPLSVVTEESVTLEAIPCPEDESFPGSKPVWTLEQKPAGSELPSSLGSGPTISFQPDVDGAYLVKAQCCSSEDVITVNAYDCPPNCSECCDQGNDSAEPVNYGTGAMRLSYSDITMSGFGLNWGHTRSYSNRLSNLSDTNGDRWMVRQCAQVTRPNQDDTVVIVSMGPRQRYVFDNFVIRNGGRQLLKKVSAGYQFIEANGTAWEFHDFLQTSSPQGELKSITPAGGMSPLQYQYDVNGRLDNVARTATVNAQTITQKLQYSYNLQDRVEQITLTRKVGAASPVSLRRATYIYSGNLLEQVDLEHLDGTWQTTGSHYYRYHATGDNLLKLVLEPAAYAYAQQELSQSSSNVGSATDAELEQYANYYFEYDGEGRVSEEQVQGGSRTYGFTYEPITTSADPNDFNKWYYKTVETLPDGNTNTVYSNIIGRQLLKEHSAGGKSWIEYKVYSSEGYLTERWTPAAVQGYLVAGNTLSVTSTANGLIHLTEYATATTATTTVAGDVTTTVAGDVAGYAKAEKLRQGNSGNDVTLSETKYFLRTDANGRERYPIAERTVYQLGGELAPTTTKYSYQWHGTTSQLKQRETIMPAVSVAQHGENIEHSSYEVFDEYGNEIWQQGARGFMRYQEYDQARGILVKAIEDVDTTQTGDFSNLPAEWSTPANGGKHLITDHIYDDEGRQTQTLGPVHNALDDSGTEIELRSASWSIYKNDFETWSAQGYQKTSDSSLVLVNPMSIARRTVDGTITDSIVAEYDGLSALPDPATYDFDDQDNWFRWSSQHTDQFGRQVSSRVYHAIPAGMATNRGTAGTNYDETIFSHDGLNRQDRTVSPGGTITRTVFDDRGRVMSTWVGTDDNNGAWTPSNTAGTNLVKVTEHQYDNGGIGNGLLTQQTEPVDDSPINDRITSFEYDWRNRQTKSTLPPDDQSRTIYTQQAYDNIGRTIQSQTYLEKVSGDELISKSETLYDDRGRAYQQLRYEVSNGVAGNKLIDRTWYDCCGNAIKQQAAGGKLFSKTEYDSFGRAEKTFTGFDVDESLYSEALTLTGDTIFEQSQTVYDETGNVTASISWSRYGSAITTGALVAGTTARVTYSANWYDSLGRSVVSAEYGNQGDDSAAFDRSVLAVPASSSATALVTKNVFNEAGELAAVIDTAGRTHITEFDHAGRTTRTIQNYTGSGDPRSGNNDQNIAVDTTYTTDGQVATLTALQKSEANDQVTTYVYGTEGVATPLIYRNDLLRAEIYPDSDNTINPLANGPSGYDRVEYEYDRQGQILTRKDQNETVHQYTYDKRGRLLVDEVTAFGTGIDDSVAKIETNYDERGQVATITSCDDQDVPEVVNQIERTYNDLGQLVTEKQATTGSVDDNTPKVTYGYDLTVNGSGEFTRGLRQKSITYPDGRKVHYIYNSTGNSLNRVSSINQDNGSGGAGSALVTYEYLGIGSPVSAHLNEPDVKLEQDIDSDNSYSAIDRFGRIVNHRWRKGASTDLVHLKHGYDTAGNRLWREDVVAFNNGQDFDELYGYDETNRLTSFERGALNVTHDAISSKAAAQDWNLDPLGNWEIFQDDTDGNGWDFTQTRTHSRVNEVKTISNWANPQHDRAGNMTEIPRPEDLNSNYDATWDAWSRLVLLEDATVKVAEYQYDGLNRRTLKETYTTGGTPDVTRHFYYSQQWQVLEERIDTLTVAERQFVWGGRYVDDLVLKDRDTTSDGVLDERHYALQDALFNVVAMVDDQGTVLERYVYTAYGECAYLDGVFTPHTTQESCISNEYLYTGRRLDPETGLQLNRNRFYASHLGRWVNRDPIGYEGRTLNLYEYVGNNPIIFLDPDGLVKKCLCKCKVFGVPGQHVQTRDVTVWTVGSCSDACKKTCGEDPVDDSEELPQTPDETTLGTLCPPETGPCSNCTPEDYDRALAALLNAKDRAWIANFFGAYLGWNTCERWSNAMCEELPDNISIFSPCLQSVNIVTFDIGGWASPRHAPVEVTLCDGTVFYFDNGAWGGDDHTFFPANIPGYATPSR